MNSKLSSKDFFLGGKIIYSYLSKYRQDIKFLSILAVFSALANGVLPLIIGRFFDAIIKPVPIFLGTLFEMPTWVFLLIIWFLVQALSNVSDWLISNKARYISLTLQSVFTSENISRVLFLPISFHKKQRTGELGDAIGKAGWQLGSIVQNVVVPLSAQFLSIVIGLVVSFFISPFVGFLLLGGISVYVYLLFLILPESANLQDEGQKAWNRAYDEAYQALSSVHSIKQATAEKYEEKKLKKKFIDDAVVAWFKIEKIWNKINFSQKILITSVQLCIFIYLAQNVYSGNKTIGDMVTLVGYSSMVFLPFTALGHSWQTIQSGMVSLMRVENLLNVSPEKYAPGKAVILDTLHGGIEFQNVSFGYKRGQNILEKISFSVKPGEVVALVGESGVGKTTLMELLSGYYFPSTGKVLVDGHNIRQLDLWFLRENIGIVPQETVLFNDTVLNNIKYGKFGASKEEVIHAAEEAQARGFIEKFEKKYEQVVGERGIRLSVGQKQRISIARAILRDPKILILDEPTSALDSVTERQITQSLEKLMTGRTTFIIAHRLSTVRKADKIFVLENKTIVEAGSHDELMQKENGSYRKLYEMHIGLE